MESQDLLYDNIQEQAYDLACKLAREQLATMSVEELCRKAGVQPADSNNIIVEYLNQSYLVTLPNGEISLKGSGTVIPPKDKILILHYLTTAKGTPITNKLITYKQLPGGVGYFPAFSQRATGPILKRFGKEPELLVDAAQKFGGYKARHGDVSMTINAFPRVPITIVLWRGDDEFAPGGSILFDSSISDYLSTEDVAVLCETVIWKLVKGSG
jgi:hypothetical protein